MAGRPRTPRQGNVATTVAVLVLAGCFAAPVLAASDRGSTLCDSDQGATLDIAGHELTLTSHEAGDGDVAESVATTIDSVAEDHLLKPRVEATAREVFAESESDHALEDAIETQSDDELTTPSLRPVSDNKLAPVRRQMYRKDI